MPFDSTPVVAPVREEIDILKRTKAVILTPDLWCKDQYERWEFGLKSHCLVGALMVVDRGSGSSFSRPWRNRKVHDVINRLATFCGDLADTPINCVLNFNDKAKDHSDVLGLINKAIKSYEEET